MAEKYGTIPPKFTKAWFEYVWTYYKWHIVIPVIVIIFAGVTCYQCAHQPQYDAEVIYAGHSIFSDEQSDAISAQLSEYSEDIDENGESSVFFQQLTFSEGAGNAEMNYAMQVKLDLQFQDGEAFIFLYDKEETEIMMNRDSAELIYLPVQQWADTMPPDDMLYTQDGTAYAVSLAGNQKLRDMGINTDDLYITIRMNTLNGDEAKYENSKRIANALISKAGE